MPTSKTDHAALAHLVGDLDTAGNPFFVFYPSDQDLEWFVSVSKNVGPFGGYDMHRHDPAASEDAKTTAADPSATTTDVLDCVNHR